jgi:nitroreductase
VFVRQVLRKILGKSTMSKLHLLKSQLRLLNKTAGFLCLKFFASREFLSRIYYGFFSPSLGREAKSVLSGRIKFYQQSLDEGGTEFGLRRGLHRLEKGISMVPRRSVFASLYIEEVVNAFSTRYRSKEFQVDAKREQMEWGESVLVNYFQIVQPGQDVRVDRARALFEKRNREEALSLTKKPYAEADRQGARLGYEELLKLAKFRRSVRWFTGEAVPREVFEKAAMIATQAPSACNRQPFRYRFFDDPQMVKKVAKLPPGVREIADNFASFVVIVGRLEAYFDEKDRHLIYIDSSLATMLLILGLETLGVSSCCINWPDSEPEESDMRQLLKLKDHERAVMCLALGYATSDGMIPYSGKKPPSDLVVYN